jgi:sphinganine C4-monooxygenase
MIMDTWQYFLHRFFHANKYLYRTFHAVHHRLYVPYAFGALYNHWFEGLLLDSLGAVISHSLSLMTVRQGILLFTLSTLKTVDDHCGYSLPFDPFQWLFPNNSLYHDIHHQVSFNENTDALLKSPSLIDWFFAPGMGDQIQL